VIADELLEPDELLHADEPAEGELADADGFDDAEPNIGGVMAEPGDDAELDEIDDRQQPLPIDGVVSSL
jgi:hypothetical protein